MARYIARRILQTVPTLLGVTLLVFVLVRLTGDPAAILLPPEASPAVVAEFRAEYGLDQSLPVQYATFVGNAVTGDLGDSIRYRESVLALLLERLPATLELAFAAILLAILIGVPLGLLGGLYRNSFVDTLGRVLALGGQAVPTFYLGIMLIIVFGVWLQALPTVGRDGFSSLILPAVTLALHLVPLVLRVTRGGLLDVVRQDYIRTARAKGASERRVVGVHMVKNSLIPVVTVLGLQVGAALSGAIVTETVYSWPGIGQLLVGAIATRDFPVVQGVAILAALAFILVNLLVDVSYTLLDPRIRLS